MALEFARRLQDIIAIARRDSRTSLSFGLGLVADIIVESLDTIDSSFPTINTDSRSAAESIELACAAAETLDACHLIEAALFSAHAECCFLEFALPRGRTHDSLAQFLDETVRSVRGSSFVYVVWNHQPERCLHLARSHEGHPRTLGLIARGKLLTALQQGSMLAVLLPSPATAAMARDVEAALLAVLVRQRLLPAVGGVSRQVPEAPGTAYLAEISRLFRDFASRLRSPAPSELAE
jgi:hypothetical protein